MLVSSLIGYSIARFTIKVRTEVETTTVTNVKTVTTSMLATVTVMAAEIETVTQVKTTTDVRTVTEFKTVTTYQLPQPPFLELGERLSVVMPFIYFDDVVYYQEDLQTMDKRWIANGTYKLTYRGLEITTENACVYAYNNEIKIDRYKVYRLVLTIPDIKNEILVSLWSSRSDKHYVSVKIDSNRNTRVYLEGRWALNQISVPVNTERLELLFAYTTGAVEIFAKRETDDD
ncbi:MAG: hypothetical protein QXT53_07600 [Ignisphaera sp.]